MKSDRERFIVPGELGVFRMRYKEGVQLGYIVHQKNSTQFYGNKTEALRAIKWPKSTPTGAALREWFDQFAEQDARLLGESPHQDAIATVSAETPDETHLDLAPCSVEMVELAAEELRHEAEILPFEVTAEDLEEEENPCENTRMVV